MKDFFSHPAFIAVCIVLGLYAGMFTAMYFSKKADINIAYGQAITTQGDTIRFYGGTLKKPFLQDYCIKNIKIK